MGSVTVTLPAFLNTNVTGTVLPKGRSPVSPVITRLMVPTTSGACSSVVVVTTGEDELVAGASDDEPVGSALEDGVSAPVDSGSDDSGAEDAAGLSPGRTTC